MFNRTLLALKSTAGQRKGIFAFFLLIFLLQMIYLFVDFKPKSQVTVQEREWLSLQENLDALKVEKEDFPRIVPFNPNFISDYKGYKLGMSVAEIDRLHTFRSTNKYVNSIEEFQKVTGVSISLLKKIAPYFKFPDWVNNKKVSNNKVIATYVFKQKEKVIKKELNLATAADFEKIYGIGEVIALRILNQRKNLKGFVAMEQLNDVWGLSAEVIENLNAHFYLSQLPQLELIDINNASVNELSQFFYFKYALAKQIVIYRSMNGDIKNIEDLAKIKGFPVDKAKIIALYLKF